MAELAPSTLWFTIAALGLGTYLIRFSFLGFLGGRTLPPLALRLLRYVPVAVFPALVAPQVLWPTATGGNLMRRASWRRSAPCWWACGAGTCCWLSAPAWACSWYWSCFADSSRFARRGAGQR